MLCLVCTINEVVFSEESRACKRNDEGVRKEEGFQVRQLNYSFTKKS